MKNLILLNAKAEPALRWHPPVDYSFVADLALLPLQAAEAGKFAALLPLAIVKSRAHTSGWSLVLVCGQKSDHNSMVSAGKWLLPGIPDSIRYLPFSVVQVGRDKTLAAIDPVYAGKVIADEDKGVPVYGDDGQLHPLAKKRLEFLGAHQSKIRRTQEILALLDKAGLLTVWPGALRKAGNVTIEGLYTIDEKALHALDDAAFLSLRKVGALAVAYSCLMSLYQLRHLAELSDIEPASGVGQTSVDLDLEFMNDSDTIKFGPLQ